MTRALRVALVSSMAAAIATLPILHARPRAQSAPSSTAGALADDAQTKAEQEVMESMAHHHHAADDPHLHLTVRRPEQPGDRARAEAIMTALQPTLERYRDFHRALQDGYEIFLPQLPQPEYHFTNYAEGVAAARAFKPDHPTSMLYEKTADGYELRGAMYTAPRGTPEAELDRRVPLSIAQWHVHVNICAPPQGTIATADLTKFGTHGSIVTREACAAAGGRFFPQIFGWMVHVYPFEKTLEQAWGTE